MIKLTLHHGKREYYINPAQVISLSPHPEGGTWVSLVGEDAIRVDEAAAWIADTISAQLYNRSVYQN